jgi:hypothetical protein
MRTIAKTIVALALPAWLGTCSMFGQANDQSPQPSSPQDRISPTGELNAKAQQQLITVRVVGATLRDNGDSPIGHVEDLIVDPESGRIEFLIVVPYFPTNSAKVKPIPWKAVTHRSEQASLGRLAANQVFALKFPRAKLQGAPAFERYKWPDMSQPEWRQQVYGYFSVKPDDSGSGAAGNESERTGGAGASESTKTDAKPEPGPELIGPPPPPRAQQ